MPALDGVRGLAILLVMASHLFPGTPHSTPERFLRAFLSFGATGVDLFFVLSGFLITGILYDSLGEAHFFRKFYARRALRILPLYYGVLVAYAITGFVQHRSPHGELLSLFLYLQNTSVIAPPIFFYGGPLFLPLGHFWSLAIEEQFYLVWPFLVFLLRGRARLLAVCALFIVACPVSRLLAWEHGARLMVVHSSTVCRADSLLIGGAVALLLRSRFHDKTLRVVAWFFLLVPAVPLISVLQPISEASLGPWFFPAIASLSYTLFAVGYAGLLVLALSCSSVRGLFSVKPMRQLGRYSYGLYVLHLILLAYLEPPLRDALRTHMSKGMVVAVVGVVGFVVSLSAAILSYQLYERHFLRLKRFFDYRPHTAPSPKPHEVALES